MIRVRTGDQFGEWTVLEYRPGKSLCRCSCGVVRDVLNASLNNGRSQSCGHREPKKVKKKRKIKALSGISALMSEPKSKSKSGFRGVYEIPGSEKYSAYMCFAGKNLYLGVFESVEEAAKARRVAEFKCLENTLLGKEKDEIWKSVEELKKQSNTEGTSLTRLTNKPTKRSTTGYRGVYRIKGSDKYKAVINFKGEVIYLGSFKTVEEAAEARKRAEKEYFKPVLKKYDWDVRNQIGEDLE